MSLSSSLSSSHCLDLPNSLGDIISDVRGLPLPGTPRPCLHDGAIATDEWAPSTIGSSGDKQDFVSGDDCDGYGSDTDQQHPMVEYYDIAGEVPPAVTAPLCLATPAAMDRIPTPIPHISNA